MPWTAFAAELATAEVLATPNDVTVEQGATANFNIQVSASGQNQCGSTSTAAVMTTFSLSAAGVLSSNNLSSVLNFSAPGSGTNCAVTWAGAPTAFSVAASVTAAATTPIGNYNIVLSPTAGTTQVTNSNATGGKLADGTATTIVVHVVAPADTTPPVITPTVSPATPNGLNNWYVSNVTVNWSVSDAQSTVTGQSGCGTTTITADQLATTYTCEATSGGGKSSASVTIKRDATNPTISATLAPASPASTGWYNIATGAPTASFTCGDPTPGSGLAVGACPAAHIFGQGAGQSHTGTVADQAGNSNSATVSGISVDTIAPTIDSHANETVEATAANGAIVTYSNPTAHDSGSGVGATSCTPAAGSQFSLGNTTVTCSVTDTAGNSASSTFQVIVQDTIAPAISQPSNLSVEAVNANGAVVTYNTPAATDAVDGTDAVSCTPASGSTFALGSNTVTCTSTDQAGNSATATFTILILDTTAPVLSLPNDIIAEATSNAGADVTFNATASDAVDGAVTPGCVPPSGSTFALGVTPVNCSATDSATNASSGSFNVTVQDTTAPIIAPHGDETAEATSSAGAVVNYISPATNDAVDGTGTATCQPAAGSTFALGNTTVTCTATDAAHNVAEATTFVVHVVDTTAPVIAAHNDETTEATGPDGAVVSYTSPASSDAVDGPGIATCQPAAGSTFALGDTTVTCNATDAYGNAATATTFVVHIIDTTAPALALPSNQTAEAAGPNGVVVNFAATALDIVDGGVSVLCTPADGAIFPLGTTTVNCSATDAHHNTSNGSFDVTVEDTTPPDLTLPTDITTEASGPSGVVVSYVASATDLVDGSLNANCAPASGSTFALGTTVVSCLAIDSHGNQSPGGFTVTVVDTTAPVIAAHGDETAETTGPNGAAVTYTSPATADSVSGPGTATCTPASGSTFALGNTTVTCSATDAAGNHAIPTTFVVHVVDTIAPTVNCGAADALWHAGDVSIACTASDSGSGLTAGNASFLLSTNVASGTETATAATNSRNVCDLANNCTQAGPITGNKVDKKAPTGISFVGSIINGGLYYYGSVPAAPTCTATDAGSGLAPCVVSGYSTAIGAQTLTATAKDNMLNTATATLNYSVNAWTLKGFYQPTDMGGVYNTVKNGSTVPLKFEIFAGTTELTDIAAVKSVTQVQFVCSAGIPEDAVEEVVTTTGGTVLRYDSTGGQFIDNWKTPSGSSVVGKCYRVTMTTQDGSTLIAFFKLK